MYFIKLSQYFNCKLNTLNFICDKYSLNNSNKRNNFKIIL